MVSELDPLVAEDVRHVWHPYASMRDPLPPLRVVGAQGVRLRLADGRELIDGMSSWWSAIHGYGAPELKAAVTAQVEDFAHVMFGGLTHAPAVQLARRLVEIAPPGLDRVFFSDSGSVAIEVGIKMALQYWHAVGRPRRQRLLTVRSGYHGDTFAAMSVCDPVTGMHGLFSKVLPQQLFAPAPPMGFDAPCTDADVVELRALMDAHTDEVAAVVLEPIVQGAGGMRFYSPEYLRRVRAVCDEHDVLLLLDEIATGFGRTGKLFASEHAGVCADILCVGKALTGGTMTLAATMCTGRIADGISSGEPGVFMHGPTFMANPLACRVALASIDLLLASPWEERIRTIEEKLRSGIEPCRTMLHVSDVRALGAIGVVELAEPVHMRSVQAAFVDAGVWIRPFGRLVYTMPPFVIDDADLATITGAIVQVVGAHGSSHD